MWRYFATMERLEAAHREDNDRSRNRRFLLRQHGSQDMTDTEFVKSFRLSRELFEDLMDLVDPVMKQPSRVGELSTSSKVYAALAFYASGSYQTLVGQHSALAMSQPSVSRAVHEVTEALNTPQVCQKYIHFPQNAGERNAIKLRFYERYHLPGVIGCIDCTHVALIRPSLHEERYFNRKLYHSKNVQIICDVDYNVLSVDASFGGATHDSFIFNQHPVKAHMINLNQQGEQVYLLGDSGYGLREYMMIPIINAQPRSPEEHYTQIQMSARSTVERAIGVIKARWRCLLSARELHYDPATVGKIVNGCVVLHNMCNKKRVPYTPLTEEEQALEEELNYRQPHVDQQNVRRRRRFEYEQGLAARAQLVNTLWQQRGPRAAVAALPQPPALN